MGGIVGFIAVALAGAAVAVATHRWQAGQRARTRAVADRHGLEVDLDGKRPPPVAFDLFEIGRRRQVDTQMWRPGERDSVFQYQYTVGSGKSSTTHHRTAVLIDLPFRAPHLVISSENVWSRVKRAVGLRDIEVESPEFNRRYQVRSRDDRFAITLLDPAMIAWMLSTHSGRGSVTFEFLGSWLLCHCDRLDVEELPRMLRWAQSVRDRLPAVLTELYRPAAT